MSVGLRSGLLSNICSISAKQRKRRITKSIRLATKRTDNTINITFVNNSLKHKVQTFRQLPMKELAACLPFFFLFFMVSCSGKKAHIAPGVYDRDSASMMVSYGINTLISDSGIMKYRIVSEEWEVNTVRQPSRWIFNKGLFMEQFDEQFHIEAYVQSDTAFYFDSMHLWELRGNVRVRTVDGLRFASQELFWNQDSHEFYSTMYSRLVTPERTMEGTYFRSDERMTKYTVTNSKGSFESADFNNKNEEEQQAQSENQSENDSITNQPIKRKQTEPMKKSPVVNNVTNN